MQEAHALLLERGLNSADCAAKCGFSDPSYFSKVFKKHFGFSPKNCK
jgi:AraC-like DNA-binding protein